MKENIKKHFGNNQKLLVEDIIDFLRSEDKPAVLFTVRQNVDNYVYFVEALVIIEKQGVVANAIFEDNAFSINRYYTQTELYDRILELDEKAVFIRNFFK